MGYRQTRGQTGGAAGGGCFLVQNGYLPSPQRQRMGHAGAGKAGSNHGAPARYRRLLAQAVSTGRRVPHGIETASER